MSEIKVPSNVNSRASSDRGGGQFISLATHEAWNIDLVWHWDGQARKCFDNCYRPMFNVADNSILIVDQQNQHN